MVGMIFRVMTMAGEFVKNNRNSSWKCFEKSFLWCLKIVLKKKRLYCKTLVLLFCDIKNSIAIFYMKNNFVISQN